MKIEISLDTKDDDAAMVTRVLEALWGESFADSIPTRTTRIDLSADGTKGPPLTTPGLADADKYAFSEEEALDLQDQHNPEGAPDVDSRGLPWDERIHASTKATNGDGSWRNKRGVDKALLEAVEAELAQGPDEIAAATPVDLPAPPGNAPVATVSGAADVAGVSEIPLPPAPAAEEAAGIIPDAPADPTPADAPTFKDAMAIVTTRQREGTLTQVQVSEAAQALGLSSVVDLAKPANAEHIAAFIALLG